jgi:hypothetical protein
MGKQWRQSDGSTLALAGVAMGLIGAGIVLLALALTVAWP